MNQRRLWWIGLLAIALAGCGDDGAARVDGGTRDARRARDGGGTIDAGGRDAGGARDAGPAPDAGRDAGVVDETGALRGIWVTRFAYRTKPGAEAGIDRGAARRVLAGFFRIRSQ